MENRIYQCAQCQRRLPQEISYCPQCGHAVGDAIANTMMDPPTAEFASPFPPRTTWQLTLVRPDGQQVVFPLADRLRIGRSDENELPLQDHQISRFHALIEKVPDGFQISDLGSTNGTFVNRKRVHVPVRLRLGDMISIGDFRLMVQRDSLLCGHCAKLVKSDFLHCPHCGEALTGLLGAQETARTKGTDRLSENVPKAHPAPPQAEVPKKTVPSPAQPAPVERPAPPPAQPVSKAPEVRRQPLPEVKAAPPPVRPTQAAAQKPQQPAASRPASKGAAALPPQQDWLTSLKESALSSPDNGRQRIILGCAIAFVVGLCGLAVAALLISRLISQGVL